MTYSLHYLVLKSPRLRWVGEEVEVREGRIQYKRKIEMARDCEKKLYTQHPSLLADQNKSGQSDREGKIAI